MTSLNWGILGAGSIARTFARGLARSTTGTLVAVGSRHAETAEAFGEEFNVPHRHAGYQELLDDPDVQAVYIATPHPFHAEWALRAAAAGKHILCEKPLTMTAQEAETVIAAAQAYGVFLMEAFMYRCHPQIARLVELLRDGAIGKVRVIQVSFSFASTFDPSSRLYDPVLGGGGILDVGCYCASMSRLVAGAALGQPFAEPIDLSAVGHLGATGVDEYTAAVATFPDEIIAQLSTGITVRQESAVRIYGTEGWLYLPSPWFGNPPDGQGHIQLIRPNAEPEWLHIPGTYDQYTLEADIAAEAIAQGQLQAPPPAMTWDDTLGNMRLLDRWREALRP